MKSLLKIINLSISFNKEKKVVESVSIEVPIGKTIALVGESGSGKTLTALSILKLLPSSASYPSGEILFNKKNLLVNTPEEIQKVRGGKITAIFQEPMLSLNPLQ